MNLNNHGEVYVTFDTPTAYGAITTSNINSGLTLTSGTSTNTIGGFGSTSVGYVGNVGIGTTYPTQTLEFRQPTYNDFWKFDEEFDLLWKSFFDPNALYRPIKEIRGNKGLTGNYATTWTYKE